MIPDLEMQLRARIAAIEQQCAALRLQNSELLSQLEWHPSAATTNTALVPPLPPCSFSTGS